MKDHKYFFVYIEWGFTLKKKKTHSYDKCIIMGENTKDDAWDGQNYVSHGGSEGMECFYCKSLEEAIIDANFNPGAIKFIKLSRHERKELKKIMALYTWSSKEGLIKKE